MSFFVSPVESGELCLFASMMGEPGDVFYPKLDPERDMVPFSDVVKDMLADMGLGCRQCASSAEAKAAMSDLSGGWPCEFFGSDTDGEKPFEEFYTSFDEKDEATYANLGVVKNAKRRPPAEVESIFAALRAVFDSPDASKERVVAALAEYLPDFHHASTGKSLDGRM